MEPEPQAGEGPSAEALGAMVAMAQAFAQPPPFSEFGGAPASANPWTAEGDGDAAAPAPAPAVPAPAAGVAAPGEDDEAMEMQFGAAVDGLLDDEGGDSGGVALGFAVLPAAAAAAPPVAAAAATAAPVDGGAVVLVSENGDNRITLQGDVATIGAKKSTTADPGFKDWRSGKFVKGPDGDIVITYVCKKKGGTVEYCIAPDFARGTFTGNVSYEE